MYKRQVQSYRGQLCFGLIACRRALPDVKELALQLERAMQALRALPLPQADTPQAEPAAQPVRRQPKLKVVKPTKVATPPPVPAKAARTRRPAAA